MWDWNDLLIDERVWKIECKSHLGLGNAEVEKFANSLAFMGHRKSQRACKPLLSLTYAAVT